MYYWVVLLFAFVSIMIYRIAGRSDEVEHRVVPRAEPYVASFSIQHEAAVSYVKKKISEYRLAVIEAKANKEPIEDVPKPYANMEEITYAKYAPYTPEGYEEPVVGGIHDYTSKIYCVNKLAAGEAGDCYSDDSVDFLITFGDFPGRYKSGEISQNIFLNALGKYTSRDANVGIGVKAATPSATGVVRGSKRVIKSMGGATTYIPQYFSCVEGFDPAGKLIYLKMLSSTSDAILDVNSGCAHND